jgi:hypothetical protein
MYDKFIYTGYFKKTKKTLPAPFGAPKPASIAAYSRGRQSRGVARPGAVNGHLKPMSASASLPPPPSSRGTRLLVDPSHSSTVTASHPSLVGVSLLAGSDLVLVGGHHFKRGRHDGRCCAKATASAATNPARSSGRRWRVPVRPD